MAILDYFVIEHAYLDPVDIYLQIFGVGGKGEAVETGTGWWSICLVSTTIHRLVYAYALGVLILDGLVASIHTGEDRIQPGCTELHLWLAS